MEQESEPVNIVNQTLVNTQHLKTLIRAVAEKELYTPLEIAQLHVRIVYRRRTHARPDGSPGGYAYYKSSSFCLKFVRGVQPDVVSTAKTIGHELAHCQGVHHGKAMSNTRYGWKKGWRETWGWAGSYPLEMRSEEKVKLSKVDDVTAKVKRCQEALDAWNRKAKMAKTKIRKWTTRLGYYEKRLAAMTPAHEEAVQQVEKVMEIVKGESNGNG